MKVSQNNFLYTLTRIRMRLFAYLEAELAEHGITDISPSCGHIMFVLDQKGPLTLQELARHAEKDKSTVSSVIKRLEAGGYVAKVRGKDDGRFVRIKLTARAKKIKPAIWEISNTMNDRLFSGLSREEKNSLFELIGRVCDNADGGMGQQ
ncbi:MAG TPA: MarR family transcriptional regulator [Spirochaetota bacterium]|mgnify:CR=1 FL=1|nr:MarR family transcriptional regulator [Spirochaetota bacterium]HPV39673.1 MarR family transcriptional regulator [Spirochaetota bacterium]